MRGIHKLKISHFGIVSDRIKRALENRGFEFIDTEHLDALDPTDEQDAERIEALYEWLRGELRLYPSPASCGLDRSVVIGPASGLVSCMTGITPLQNPALQHALVDRAVA